MVHHTPQDQIHDTLAETIEVVAGETIRIPGGQPLALEQFADALRLAEAPGSLRGGGDVAETQAP